MNFLPTKDTILLSLLDTEMPRADAWYQPKEFYQGIYMRWSTERHRYYIKNQFPADCNSFEAFMDKQFGKRSSFLKELL